MIFGIRVNRFNVAVAIWLAVLFLIYLSDSEVPTTQIPNIQYVYTEEEKVLLEQQNCVRNSQPCPRLDLNRTKDTVIDLKEFLFILNSAPCDGSESVVVLVHTAINHTSERNAIRSTWGRPNQRFKIKLVFLLGLPTSGFQSKEILKEHEAEKDIVQGNFIDSYRNLTYKHVMGLKWSWNSCSASRRLMKIDDDIFVHIFNFRKLVRIFENERSSIICYIQQQMPVTRDNNSKWQVTIPQYPRHFFEDYCSGWAYLMTPDIARRLYLESQYRPYFWVDDVHVTGTLAKMANIPRIKINNNFTTEAESTAQWAQSKLDKDWKYTFGPTWGDQNLVYKAHRKALQCKTKKCKCCFDLYTVRVETENETFNSPRKGKAQVIPIS